ncbi:MAG: leucine-rich repeat protein, partial [Clostridia bacterium]|nr:leucine-rich repeat protein [Clostridia bacterium]
VKIPSSVKKLVPYVFYGCRSLTSIVIPDSITNIYNTVFLHCDSLADVYYTGSEEQWQSIAINTKDNDCLLNQATIHYNSTEQPEFEYTVADNEIIITKYTGTDTEVKIPSEIDGLPVTAIGDNVFQSWKSTLTSVTIPESVTSIGNYAFQGCMNLTSVTIPDSVVSIGDYAFHVSGLTSVTIPENVTSIGEEAFGECFSLTNINVDSNNTEYSSVDGVLFDKNQITILCYPLGKTETSYTIPNGVTSIGNFTFICCNTLTNVIIPESVIDIGMCAFYNCNNLADVYYTGSEEQWQNIIINGTGNQWLNGATIYYDCPNVVLDKEELTLEAGQMYTLTATVNPPTETTFTWKSNNTSVATVNGSGRVVARGEGTATITVVNSDGKRAYCTVTVLPKKEIVLDKTELNLSVKEQYTLSPSMLPEDTTVTYTFKSNNTAVATVNKAGRIVARGEGTATITVIGSNGLKAYCTVNVTPQKILVLDKTELNLSVKEQYTLNPSIVPEDTEVTYTFKSDNTAVATVNKAGRIVARGTGTAKITVKSSNGLTAVCNITVE